jgi:hypothetical protein
MIKVEFEGYPKAEVIIYNNKMEFVRGFVECTVCKKEATLYKDKDEDISNEIEFFIKNHKCSIKDSK